MGACEMWGILTPQEKMAQKLTYMPNQRPSSVLRNVRTFVGKACLFHKLGPVHLGI